MTTHTNSRSKSKTDLLIAHLQRPAGASIDDLAKVTGWHVHSVRGAMAGAVRKKGHAVHSEKVTAFAAIDWPSRPMRELQVEVKALERLDLFEMRAAWAEQFGPAPRFQSVELFRLMLAWRIQEAVVGGLDPTTKKALGESRSAAEGLEFGTGATIRRQWKDEEVVVSVVDGGFAWNGTTFRSLSAVATAITGARWNGPKFFGLRS